MTGAARSIGAPEEHRKPAHRLSTPAHEEAFMTMRQLFRLSLAAGALALASPALAEPDYDEEMIQALAKVYDWGPDVAKVMITPGKTYAQMKADIKTLNDNLVAFLRTRQCKDKAHADHIESEIHKQFHEWYKTVAPDIKHGVNMSCSHDHKLVPTVWITDFKLLPKWEAGVKTAHAGADKAAAPRPSPGLFGCKPEQLKTPAGKACVSTKDAKTHVLVCRTTELMCCITMDGRNVSGCVTVSRIP
jgi:hypothetical protein